jgi:hypothetical protein
MRTLGVAVAVLAAVGCAEDGVFVEVVASDGVTEVELFVVDRECEGTDTQGHPCEGLQPDGFDVKLGGSIFIRDQDEGESWKVSVDDGAAWFKFGVDRLGLQRVVVVGFKNGEPEQYAVLTDVDLSYSHKVVVTLADVDEWTDADDDGEKPVVMLWGDGRCLGLHHGDESWFIVTEGDADCDQVEGTECDPLAYLVDTPMMTRCLTDVSGTCTLGTTICSERGATSDEPCEPGDLELPAAACERCGTDPTNECFETAFLESHPRMVCYLHYDPMFGACEDSAAGGNAAPLIDPTPGDTFCPDVIGIAESLLPIPPVAQWDQAYVGPGWVLLDMHREPDGGDVCWNLTWAPFEDGTMMTIAPEDRTLVLRYQANAAGLRPFMVPLDINFVPDCEGEPKCRLEDGP